MLLYKKTLIVLPFCFLLLGGNILAQEEQIPTDSEEVPLKENYESEPQVYSPSYDKPVWEYNLNDYFSLFEWIVRDDVKSLRVIPRRIENNPLISTNLEREEVRLHTENSFRLLEFEFYEDYRWNNQSKSLYEQYLCHQYFANSKEDWNIEPQRPLVNGIKMISSKCNPPIDGSVNVENQETYIPDLNLTLFINPNVDNSRFEKPKEKTPDETVEEPTETIVIEEPIKNETTVEEPIENEIVTEEIKEEENEEIKEEENLEKVEENIESIDKNGIIAPVKREKIITSNKSNHIEQKELISEDLSETKDDSPGSSNDYLTMSTNFISDNPNMVYNDFEIKEEKKVIKESKLKTTLYFLFVISIALFSIIAMKRKM